MVLRNFLFVIASILGSTTLVYGQILNADHILQDDSTHLKKVKVAFDLSGTIDKQKSNLLDVSAANDITIPLHEAKQIAAILGSMDLTTNGKSIIQNSGFIHFRIRDNDRLKFSPEYFTQFQWNGVIGMESRFLLGSNFRWMIKHDNKENLYTGLGLFEEREVWNYSGVDSSIIVPRNEKITVQHLRINQYFKIIILLSENVDIVINEFTQFKTTNLSKPRISVQSSIQFKAGKHISFLISYNAQYDTAPVVPISKYLYGGKLDLQVNL